MMIVMKGMIGSTATISTRDIGEEKVDMIEKTLLLDEKINNLF